jgi:DNA-binding Lrp family transcriptional regulator
MKLAPVRKYIYSLPVMFDLMKASNRRYIDFVAAIDDPSAGIKDLDRISRPANDVKRSLRGFNLFHGDDLDLFLAIARGEFTVSGCRNKNLRELLQKTGPQVSRMLKRLRTHGLIKKIGRTYKYYLTALGLRVVTTALKLREMVPRYCVWVNNAKLEEPARRIGQRWRAPRAPWRGPMHRQGETRPAFPIFPNPLLCSGPKAINSRGSGGLVPRGYPHETAKSQRDVHHPVSGRIHYHVKP